MFLSDMLIEGREAPRGCAATFYTTVNRKVRITGMDKTQMAQNQRNCDSYEDAQRALVQGLLNVSLH